MNRHGSHRGPDFFLMLVVLVVIGFGMTLAIQVSATDHDQMVETEAIPQNPHAG